MRIFSKQLILTLLMFGATSPLARADAPLFLVRTANGKDVRGPLVKMNTDWRIEVGKGVRHRFAATDWLSIRQASVSLPELPSDEHLVLASGDRIPSRDLRLDDEKLRFRHPDFNGGKDTFVPLSSVAMIWRLAPDGAVKPEWVRHRLLRTRKKRDQVLLRNGDTLEGTLNALTSAQIEVEVGRKNVSTKWPQVSAVILSSELSMPTRLKESHARVVLSASDRSPGGRITVVSPSFDGTTFRARTPFGAVLRVPIERVVALELKGSHVESLSDLTPSKFLYRPYLDEAWSWSADRNVRGHDLTLGGSSYDRGVGMHAESRATYSLESKYRRFDALVGLDHRDGRKGQVLIRVLVDGKPADLGKTQWTHKDGAIRISVSLTDAKEMTLEVLDASNGPIQAVVNWVEARLVR